MENAFGRFRMSLVIVDLDRVADVGVLVGATLDGRFPILTVPPKGDEPNFSDQALGGDHNEKLQGVFGFGSYFEGGVKEDGASFEEVFVFVTGRGILGLEAEQQFAWELHFHGQFLNLDPHPLPASPPALR